jgi:hypothetical protein
MYKTYEGKP